MNSHEPIPKDYEVQPLERGQKAKDKATCGHCGLSWDDGEVTGITPTPSGRCPFEYFHLYPEDECEDGKYFQVEYDLNYTGGDYSNVGAFAFVLVSLVDEVGMDTAFKQTTGFDPIHIVHWSEDDLFDGPEE